jgi:hypothetical protein
MQQAQDRLTSGPNRQNGRENQGGGERSGNIPETYRGGPLNCNQRQRQEQLDAHGPQCPQHSDYERLEVGPHPVPPLRPGQLVHHVHD